MAVVCQWGFGPATPSAALLTLHCDHLVALHSSDMADVTEILCHTAPCVGIVMCGYVSNHMGVVNEQGVTVQLQNAPGAVGSCFF